MIVVEPPPPPVPAVHRSLDDAEEGGWDEARLVAALDKLEAAHIQLRNLRETIPSLVRPMRAELATPEAVYAEFTKAATGSVQRVQEFTVSMKDPGLQEALQYAKKSKEEKPEGVVGWLAAQHEDWLKEPVALGGQGIKREDGIVKVEPGMEDGGFSSGGGVGGSSEEIVEAFKAQNSNLQAVIENVKDIIITLPSPTNMTFYIKTAGVRNGKTMYSVSCEEIGKTQRTSKLSAGVMQAFSRRPRPDDLRFTLDMIAAYSDLKTQSCQKCHRFTDREGQFAVIRAAKPSTSVSGHSQTYWEALHLGCASSGQ